MNVDVEHGKCLFCGNETIKYKYPEYNNNPHAMLYHFTDCSCSIDGWLHDGYLYPWTKRNYLCSLYSGVEGLNVSQYKKDDIIQIRTTRGKIKECKVISVFQEENKMILQHNKKYLYLANVTEIESAYDALFSCNKREYSGWWHKKLEIC